MRITPLPDTILRSVQPFVRFGPHVLAVGPMRVSYVRLLEHMRTRPTGGQPRRAPDLGIHRSDGKRGTQCGDARGEGDSEGGANLQLL